jgi:hypothetical protein
MKSRLTILIVSLFVILCAAFFVTASSQRFKPVQESSFDVAIANNAKQMIAEGRRIFRFDTFGDQAFWGDTLRLHEAIQDVSPAAALGLGLKVDSAALPPEVIRAIQEGTVNLNDPAVTRTLLQARAVVGVTGFFSGDNLTSIGIQCSLCHSTVDNSIAPGIGRRLDGWPNRDLDIGQIAALAPNLQVVADLLETDQATVRTVLRSWGPGKFDAQLLLDGKAFREDGTSAATLIPPAFGLAGINEATSTGSWGTVSYWNAFVANLEMHGQGTFIDPRLNNATKFPVAARAGFGNTRNNPDLITSKLPALHFYQLSIPAPTPPAGTFDSSAAARGGELFNTKAKCARCHVPPIFTEPGWNLHTAESIGIDDFQASRSPDKRYRTTPLRGLFAHEKGGFYHDGRFRTLQDVINHYNGHFNLGLSDSEKADLEQYLRSL